MNAMTSQQRTRLHRTRKAAAEFSADYMDGSLVATTEAFIKAKEAELCYKHNCSVVQIDFSLLKSFYDILSNYEPEEGDLYDVENMFESWKEAQEEYKQ